MPLPYTPMQISSILGVIKFEHPKMLNRVAPLRGCNLFTQKTVQVAITLSQESV